MSRCLSFSLERNVLAGAANPDESELDAALEFGRACASQPKRAAVNTGIVIAAYSRLLIYCQSVEFSCDRSPTSFAVLMSTRSAADPLRRLESTDNTFKPFTV